MRLHELPQDALRGLLRAKPADQPIAASRTLSSWDWQTLAADAVRHRVGVLLRQRLADAGQLDVVPAEIAATWLADARHAALQHGIQLRDALNVSAALSAAGIRHAFVKGLAYGLSCYQPRWLRIGVDIDLLIDRENAERARELMHTLCFVQAKFSPDHRQFWPASAEEIFAVESQHYELAEFNRYVAVTPPPDWLLAEPFLPRTPFRFRSHSGTVLFSSSVDVHWALHFVFAESAPLDDVRRLDVGIPVLSPEWKLIHSIFKLYVEAFDQPRFGFIQVADLIALLTGPALDWQAVDRMVQQHRLEAAAYYTLSCCQTLAGTSAVPEALLASWSYIAPRGEGQAPSNTIDFGDFVPYLAGTRSATTLGAPARPPAAPDAPRHALESYDGRP